MKRILIVLVLAFVLCSCGSDRNESQTDTASLEARSAGCSALGAKVFGGESCNQGSRSPVIWLVSYGIRDGQQVPLSTCTAALVTLDDFVTSAHCYVVSSQLAVQQGFADWGISALVGGNQGEVIPVVNAAFHPLYDFAVASPYDVAMGTIASVPNPPIGPLPLLGSELSGPGSAITAFGYGTNDAGATGELKAANFTVSLLSGGNLVVVGDGASSICPGDSGGPAVYTTSQGVATLAGVNSYIEASGCVSSA
ncbi:MAG: trypsin-like serine protease, partial [Bdellovibrionales bacterium]|nr:trypsin-like serine protease [Bdellovibrionales bacterium]